ADVDSEIVPTAVEIEVAVPSQIWHNGFGKQPKPYREVTANVSIPQEGRSVDRKECLPVTNGAIDSIRFTGSCERTI
ncbi:hypothetical protein, partial [Syntrophaceticus schinkii]|uniref:hypothetical protein n=1 Tax=Syntrophaceticus schinkii TaxID=499207 RepID=UPI001E35498E